jgi:hypothetical protein
MPPNHHQFIPSPYHSKQHSEGCFAIMKPSPFSPRRRSSYGKPQPATPVRMISPASIMTFEDRQEPSQSLLFRNVRTTQSRTTVAASRPASFRRLRTRRRGTNTNACGSSAQARKLCEICHLVCDMNRWNNAKDLNQLGSFVGTR